MLKKFLLILPVIFLLQLAQTARAYSPQYGDLAVVYHWYCECGASYDQIVIEPHKYSDPPPQQAHPTGCHGNKNQAHKWARYSNSERYIFSNGEWRRM